MHTKRRRFGKGIICQSVSVGAESGCNWMCHWWHQENLHRRRRSGIHEIADEFVFAAFEVLLSDAVHISRNCVHVIRSHCLTSMLFVRIVRAQSFSHDEADHLWDVRCGIAATWRMLLFQSILLCVRASVAMLHLLPHLFEARAFRFLILFLTAGM